MSVIFSDSVITPDGYLMMQGPGSDTAVLDPVTLTWSTSYDTNKAEASTAYLSSRGLDSGKPWVLLPNGRVLTVDIFLNSSSELLDLTNNTDWVSAGSTQVNLTFKNQTGPTVLRPDGTVFALGANGNSAIYNSSDGTWIAGPAIVSPTNTPCVAAQASASLLPNGNVLFVCN
jgi:hypothetical protein